jgi:hypothetical protein
MSGLARSVAGGAAGTAAAALVLLADGWLGLTPRFDLLGLITGMIQRFAGVPVGLGWGWAVHAGVGLLVWPAVWALLGPALGRVPGLGRPVVRGLVFMAVPGVVLGALLAVLAGAFEVPRPAMVGAVTLAAHLAYGLALGAVDP